MPVTVLASPHEEHFGLRWKGARHGAGVHFEDNFGFRRKGELSRYSLSGTEGSLHYHDTHIEQLRILSKMTGDKWFDRQADLFQRDGDKWRAENRGGGR